MTAEIGAASHVGPVAAVWFDLFGTLVDMADLGDACESVATGRGVALADRWRARQLEATWLRTVMGAWIDFETVTRDALDVALMDLGLDGGPAPDAARVELATAFERLPAQPEAKPVLDRLRAAGLQLGVLSNGSAGMIERTVTNAGLADHLDTFRTVDAVRRYKPDPAVYGLTVDATGLPASQIGFVTANGWDAAGASAFGLRVVWLRPGPSVFLPAVGAPPPIVATWLDLPAIFGASSAPDASSPSG
ncbi:MAG: haloacid dehalogenase type II [Candidatus Limnocylindrales bacterium]